jgi:hypothetical protein
MPEDIKNRAITARLVGRYSHDLFPDPDLDPKGVQVIFRIQILYSQWCMVADNKRGLRPIAAIRKGRYTEDFASSTFRL